MIWIVMHSCLCLWNKIYCQHLNFNVQITTTHKEGTFLCTSRQLPTSNNTTSPHSSTKLWIWHLFLNYQICCIKSYFKNNSFQLFPSLLHVLWQFHTTTLCHYDLTITVTYKCLIITKQGMAILVYISGYHCTLYIYISLINRLLF